LISDTDSFEIHGNLCISLNIIMEYSFSDLLWNENTCKTYKKQVFQNKYSNPKSENFYFLLLKMISELLHSLTVVENTFVDSSFGATLLIPNPHFLYRCKKIILHMRSKNVCVLVSSIIQ
jgi:hypothetical protein